MNTLEERSADSCNHVWKWERKKKKEDDEKPKTRYNIYATQKHHVTVIG